MPVAENVSTSTIARSLLEEFETQAPVTRRFLERLPENKLTWRPHEKSLTAGQLAYHLATVPSGIVRFVENNPAAAPEKFNFPQPASLSEVLKAHDEGIAVVREFLPRFDDASMRETWRMVAGDKVVFSQPRGLFLRDVMLSHWYQHRGQFSVYLRILGVPVPSSWGPSADEPPPFARQGSIAA